MDLTEGEIVTLGGLRYAVLGVEELAGRFHLELERAPERGSERFPRSAPDGSLIRAVHEWAKANGKTVTINNRIEAAQYAVQWGKDEIGRDSPTWIPFVLQLIHEIHDDMRGEPLATAANRQLRGLIVMYGPMRTLDAMCQALVAGAGLGEEYEEDPRAVVKYAAAILSGRGTHHHGQ